MNKAAPRSFSNDPASGPSLETYVETRFNLLVDFINEKFSAQDVAMRASMEAAKVTLEALEKTQAAALLASDLRYQQRFEAQSDALTAAFLAQQCVEASTPILCADLTWRPAGSLVVGDALVGIEDEPPPRSRGRKFCRGVVTSNAVEPADLLVVMTTGGAVRCNAAHPWLAIHRGKDTRWRWIRTDALVPGDVVLHCLDVWETDRSYEAGWLAGMLDGEGCISFASDTIRHNARLSASQVRGPTADRLEAALRSRVGSLRVQDRPASYYKSVTRQPSRVFVSSMKRDILKLLGSVRPERLLAKADDAWDGKRCSGSNAIDRAEVVSIEHVGTGAVASLSTSTNTYIAAGFVMHNTAMKTALEAAEKAVQAALAAQERAVLKAELAADKRFEAVNEFRQTLTDQQVTFMPKAEAAVTTQSQNTKIQDIKDEVARLVSERVGVKGGWGYAVGLAGFLLTLFALYRILASKP